MTSSTRPRTDARTDAQRAARELLATRIQEALAETEGNKAEAAERLGMPRRSLYRWLERLGLEDWTTSRAQPAKPIQGSRRRAG